MTLVPMCLSSGLPPAHRPNLWLRGATNEMRPDRHVGMPSRRAWPSARLPAMNRLIQIAVNGIALWVAVLLLRPGLDFHGEWWKFVLVAVAFSLVNTYLRPILRILTLPISVLSLGIFLVVINALMLLLVSAVSEQLGLGFRVANFGEAF